MTEDESEPKFDGRGLPPDYEPYDDEISSKAYAILDLIHEGEFRCVGWDDDAPKRSDDRLVFVFDHPDYEGGFMVTMRMGDLTRNTFRATHRGDGYWTAAEDVGLFSELPDWLDHVTAEGAEDGDEDE